MRIMMYVMALFGFYLKPNQLSFCISVESTHVYNDLGDSGKCIHDTGYPTNSIANFFFDCLKLRKQNIDKLNVLKYIIQLIQSANSQEGSCRMGQP